MKKFEVSFRPLAEADLIGLYDYIAAESGHEIAAGSIERIETACMALATFPERGRKRDGIRPGLRIVGFEHRATIIFQVKKTEVVIARIFYGGQDDGWVLRGEADE